jgi:MFS family permease
MPAMNNLLSRWIPVSERSRSLAFVYSGMYLGSVTGLACSPTLIQRYGWPSVFWVFGSIGAVWYAVWQQYVTSELSHALDFIQSIVLVAHGADLSAVVLFLA